MDTLNRVSQMVFTQLRPGYMESIYQRAIAAELRVLGWTVDTERTILIEYTDSAHQTHVIGTGRIDIFATTPDQSTAFIIEIKVGTGSTSKLNHRQQVRGYARQHPSGIPVLITFFSTGPSPLVERVSPPTPARHPPDTVLDQILQ